MGYTDQRKATKLPELEDSVEWETLLVEVESKFLDTLRTRYAGKTEQIKKFKANLAIFLIQPFHPKLNNHKFKGTRFRSFSFGGDHRVVYYLKDKQTAVLHDVGQHKHLYKSR